MKVSFHSLQCLCLVSASNKTCTQIADDIANRLGISNPSQMAGFFATIIQQLSLITASYAMSGDCSATSCQQGEGSLTSMQRCCQGFVVGRR
ncbi:unnamed protein product [Sphagnum jensenii]|uniref:Uncharacterized protein n=1 Tax=Sphagnum jensenii TaxID=128206 RepID=A0ABP0WKV0_9BRYO